MATKLHPPLLRSGWVDRPQLIRALDESTARLILVDAPAGYGKTTLLAQWQHQAGARRSFAWVSLDAGDNDPHRFWMHVAGALHRACPELSQETLRLLGPPEADIAGAFIPGVVNDLATAAGRVVLVLDDYHVIKDPNCHQQLRALLRHLPANAAIVLGTRADPPLPLAWMRAAGELTEIRMRDLRFTPAEAAALIAAVAAVPLTRRDLTSLLQRTEGWPAGLYLAALSLRDQPDPQPFVHRFAGSDRYIADFLTEQVINHQPPRIREFLLHTALLDRFTAPLCEAVTGLADARETIGLLERENLFVVPLDDGREWFRYHHLLARILLSQLARTEPEIIPVLHQRASDWHRRHGAVRDAIEHAIAAGNVTAAIDLIAAHWPTFVDAGRVATVRGWLARLGDDQLERNPLAAHCAVWAAALVGDRKTIRRWLPLVAAAGYDGVLPDGMQSFQSSAALLTGTFGFTGLAAARDAVTRAVQLESDRSGPWYGLAQAACGAARYFGGDFPAARRHLEEALAAGPPLGTVRLYALMVLTLVSVEQGRLRQAQELAHAARALTLDPATGVGYSPQGPLGRIATGAVDAAFGRLDQARADLEHALRARRRWPGLNPWADLEIWLRLAPVLLELGDRDGAAGLVAEARALLAAFPEGAGAQQSRLARLERRLTARPRPHGPAEPLTERELGILRLLRGSLSLREIGQELHLSPNTIKSHTRAIYRKLDARGRDDAVTRGQQLGLL